MKLFVKMHLEIFLSALLWATFVQEISASQSVPSHKIANVGETLRLKCPDTHKADSLGQVVVWRLQNTIISSNYNISSTLPTDIQDRYSIVDKDDSQYTLRILDVRESDEGIYDCGYAELGSLKTVLHSTNVTVQLPSTNDVNPRCSLNISSESSILTSNSLISLTCSIDPHILAKGDLLQWVRDDKILKSKNENTVSFSHKVSLDDINKLYTCRLISKNSKRNTKECTIRTFENPVVLSNERNDVKVGSDVNVTCKVRSSSDSPDWDLPNADILKRSSIFNRNRTLYISNVSVSDNNTDVTCSYRNYMRKATIIVFSENKTRESTTTVVLEKYSSVPDKHSITTSTKGLISDINSDYPTSSGEDMGLSSTNVFTYSTSPTLLSTEFDIQVNNAILLPENSTSSTYVTSSPPPTEAQTGFQEFLQMVHMSYWVFIAAAIGTFIFLVFMLILVICCYKYIQSKKPARLAISDSFYSGLANVHKNTNYPLHYNAMHKRGFGRNSAASSLFGEDDLEGSNLLEIIVQGKFPESCDMQFSDTLEHCNPDDSCLSSAKDFCNLNTGAKDYGTSADTLDGTDEGICSGSGETRFDFDFDSPVNTKQSKGSQQVSEKHGVVLNDTLC